MLIVAGCVVSVSGCVRGRTVFVEEGAPVKIDNARGRVWHLTEDGWRTEGGRTELPDGWYLVPPSFVDGAFDGPDAP